MYNYTKIIEIETLDNGAHRNQVIIGEIFPPEGWAIIQENLDTPNFPFGDIEVEEIDGIMTVTSWIPREIPEQEENEEASISKYDRLRADIDFVAAMTGVIL